MTAFLAQLLLTGFVLAVPATALVFVGSPRQPRLGAFARALLAAGGVSAAALALGYVAGSGPGPTLAVAVLLGLAVLANARAARPWVVRGLLAWSLSIGTGLAYLAYVAHWMLVTGLGPAAFAAAGLLWLLELFVFVLAVGYVWEIVDVLARWDWRRRVDVRAELRHPDHPEVRPFVSLHVPTHNEPPELVIETLETLLALDYDDYEVLLLDNNTDDPALWRPVEEFCARHARLRFFHLEDWPGYKSGALNFGLGQTDPRAELVGVVDADYHVQPDFLARCAPLFADARLAFVQTPQDYRDWETDSYFRRLYYSYAYFFDVSQRSRNERNGAIFGGTMGLIRRSALVEVGGWDEWCITEDAELSLRLLRAGHVGTHVEESFGRGIMPLTFEALKRQRFRWCFGGVQILRMHAGSLLPGRRSETNALTASQRWAYLLGGLQWFGDVTGLLFTLFLLAGAADLGFGGGLLIRRLSGPVLVCVLGLVVLGAVRSVALVRRSPGAGWREAVGAFGLWLGLGWVVALASVRGLLAREGTFLRTPKTRGDVGWQDALRGNPVETGLALCCAAAAAFAATAGTLGAVVVTVLLAVQAAGYAAAPLNSLSAIRADLTPELARRRRDSRLSWTRVRPVVRRAGLAPLGALALLAIAVVALAGPVGSPDLGGLPGAVSPHLATPSRTPSARTPSATAHAPGTTSPGGSASSVPSAPTASGTGAATSARPSVSARPSAAATTPTSRPGSTSSSRPSASPTARPTVRPTPTSTPTTRATGRPTTAPTHPVGPSPRPTSTPTHP